MPRTTKDLTSDDLEFLRETHVGTLATLRSDGTPHVVAIAFTYDAETGRVSLICSDETQKVINVERAPRAAVTQVDGPRWLTLEGPARVVRDAAGIADAVAAFQERYRPARENPMRAAIEIDVERILGRAQV